MIYPPLTFQDQQSVVPNWQTSVPCRANCIPLKSQHRWLAVCRRKQEVVNRKFKLKYRSLGKTGILVSEIAFGAGPVPELMTGNDSAKQLRAVAGAIELGVNWFDTAATYGDGRSESNLGSTLQRLGSPKQVHIATKVRLRAEDLSDIPGAVHRSFHESLKRLRVERVTLLQLHNSITNCRDEEPTSISPHDVLAENGVIEAFESLRQQGLVLCLGITGIGQPDAIKQVIRSGRLDTMQTPFHMLNPSAGQELPGHDKPNAYARELATSPDQQSEFTETNYGNIIGAANEAKMGVFAIRVFAGGALLGAPPSAHTYKTKFFPLDLYERDRRKAALLEDSSAPSIKQRALRFVLQHPCISSAIIGISSLEQLDELCQLAHPSAGTTVTSPLG